MKVTATRIRTYQRSRTLTDGSKYVHRSFILKYQTEDTVWHEMPNPFTDRAQAARQERELKKAGI